MAGDSDPTHASDRGMTPPPSTKLGRGGIDAVPPKVKPIGNDAGVSSGRVGNDDARYSIDEQVANEQADGRHPAGFRVYTRRIVDRQAADEQAAERHPPEFRVYTRRISQATTAAPTCVPKSRNRDEGKQVPKEHVARRSHPKGLMADARPNSQDPASSPDTSFRIKSQNRDKGKQVVKEHVAQKSHPRGFMSDARRSQGPAPSPASDTSSNRDKGKQVAKEHVAQKPRPRGFMADARRSQVPAPSPASDTSPNRVREDTKFVRAALGSTVKNSFTLRNEVFTELFPYQVDGLEWLWRIHCCGTGGLIADDMGLGKTKQILAFLLGLFESGLIKTTLISVPAAIVNQWTTEMARIGLKNIYIFREREKRTSELAMCRKSGGILITTHTLAKNNWSDLKGPWDYMVIDEAHLTCKKETLQSYLNLQKICCRHRILLTGTPSPNSLKEFRAIMNFCCPGLFSSATDFNDEYLAPIVEGNYQGSSFQQRNESSVASQKLQSLLKPCFLRRLKNVLSSIDTPEKTRLSLPEKVEFVVWLKLTPFQEKLYRALLSGDIIKKNKPGEMIVVSTLLQKICNHPNKLDKISEEKFDSRQMASLQTMVMKLRKRTSTEGDGREYHNSCKLDIIVRLLERFKKQTLRVLIFSRACEMLDAIQEVIGKKGYSYDRIDGSLNSKERDRRVQAFKKDDGAGIFLISSFSGATGLDLQVASRCIIVEPFWNPCVDDQSADRIYRVGQKQKCIIYRLVSSETIEEKMYKTQVFKLGIFKCASENKNFQRYIPEKMENEYLEIPPNGYGSSRTLRKLETKPTPTLSEEMIKELNFLKNEDVVGVSIHGALFHGAPSKKPIKSDDSVDWSFDEEEIKRMKRKSDIAYHEQAIKEKQNLFRMLNGGKSLPDGGEKLTKAIQDHMDVLAKLRADSDPKDET